MGQRTSHMQACATAHAKSVISYSYYYCAASAAWLQDGAGKLARVIKANSVGEDVGEGTFYPQMSPAMVDPTSHCKPCYGVLGT